MSVRRFSVQESCFLQSDFAGQFRCMSIIIQDRIGHLHEEQVNLYHPAILAYHMYKAQSSNLSRGNMELGKI